MITPSSDGKQRVLLIIGILMIATTLRVTFTGAAPLLDAIRADYGLTTAQTGMLTTLPLLAFALISPLAAGVARRIGMERSLFAALLLICAGIALRSLPSSLLLFIGTAVIGCGIALGNVLLPGMLKRDFAQHVAKLTGAYSLTMGAAAALGSAAMVPIAQSGAGWHGALLTLMIFPLLALLLWLPRLRHGAPAALSASGALHSRGIWRSALAWQVTLYLGINSLIYYIVIGWLPSILISQGFSEAQAGSLHGVLQLATAAPGLLVPLVLHRLRDQRAIAASDKPGLERGAGWLAARCAATGYGRARFTGAAGAAPPAGSAGYRGAGRTAVCCGRAGAMAATGARGDLDGGVRIWLRGDDDPWPHLYWPAGKLGASGRCAVGDGAVGGLSARRLRAAADGESA